jgi:hypothetical protein
MARWAAIPGYEGRYEVSDMGVVRRLDREQTVTRYGIASTCMRKGGIVRQQVNRAGYLRVTLFRGNEMRDHFVHRLVCAAFHGPAPSIKHQAAHDSGIKSDNTLGNLAWKLPIENMADRDRHGTTARGERSAGAKLTEAAVREMRSLRARGDHTFQDLADLFGVSHRAAFAAATGITWKHVGE